MLGLAAGNLAPAEHLSKTSSTPTAVKTMRGSSGKSQYLRRTPGRKTLLFMGLTVPDGRGGAPGRSPASAAAAAAAAVAPAAAAALFAHSSMYGRSLPPYSIRKKTVIVANHWTTNHRWTADATASENRESRVGTCDQVVMTVLATSTPRHTCHPPKRHPFWSL